MILGGWAQSRDQGEKAGSRRGEAERGKQGEGSTVFHPSLTDGSSDLEGILNTHTYNVVLFSIIYKHLYNTHTTPVIH